MVSETSGVCVNEGSNIRHRQNNTCVDDVNRNSNPTPNPMINALARRRPWDPGKPGWEVTHAQ